MAQLRLGYEEIQKRGAEVLQITHSTPEEARLYFQRYQLAFPYLCDPDRAVHERYGIPMVHAPVEGLRAAILSTVAGASDFLVRGEPVVSPLPYLKRYGPNAAPEQAVFIVDRDGIIRYVYTCDGIGAVPSNAELLTELNRL
jgi:putative peptide zinc metalloprotease protein